MTRTDVEDDNPFSEEDAGKQAMIENVEQKFDEKGKKDAEIPAEDAPSEETEESTTEEAGPAQPEPVKPTTPLDHAEHRLTILNKSEIDFSEAVPGENIIVKETDGKYIALTSPEDCVAKVLACSSDEAEVYRLDYVIRTMDLGRYAKAQAYSELAKYPDVLKFFYGTDDIDTIYNDNAGKLVGLKDMNRILVDSVIPMDTLEILSALSEKEQETLATILSNFNISIVSSITAREIVDGRKDEESIKEAVLLDERVFEMLARYMGKPPQ